MYYKLVVGKPCVERHIMRQGKGRSYLRETGGCMNRFKTEFFERNNKGSQGSGMTGNLLNSRITINLVPHTVVH
jgi:hypothetical protein